MLLHDPTGSLEPGRAGDLVNRLKEASGLPVGIYFQGAGGAALACAIEAARAGADLLAAAAYPVALTLHRVSSESLAGALTGLSMDPGIDVAALWRASELVDQHIGDEPVIPLAPRIAVRAAQFALPAGLVAGLDAHLGANAAGDRIDEVLDELARVRMEVGMPPLAAPVGQVLASQALLHVLSAQRWGVVVDELRDLVLGRYGAPPGQVDPVVERAVQLLSAEGDEAEPPAALEELRSQAGGLAASEEELLLLALFGDDAEPLLQAIRGRAARDEGLARAASTRTGRSGSARSSGSSRSPGIAEVTIEEEDFRVTVRSSDETAAPATVANAAPLAAGGARPGAGRGAGRRARLRSSRRWSASSTGRRSPGSRRSSRSATSSCPGQTLCLLEAMKLFNELKAEVEGVVRAVHAENGGACRVRPAPVRARAPRLAAAGRGLAACSSASWWRTAARSPSASSARATSSGSRRSRSTRARTRPRCTCGSPTAPSGSARRPPARATCRSRP